MKLIKQKFEILEQGEGLGNIFRQIELAGRTAYKSENKITNNSAVDFVDMLINLKHYAALEHGTVYLKIPVSFLPYENEHTYVDYINNKYSKCVVRKVSNNAIFKKKYAYVTTNYRVIIENHWEEDLEFLCAPSSYHVKRYTVKCITNRQITHELVRHRTFSFLQESSRYCDYSNENKFNSGLTFIKPLWLTDDKEKKIYLDYLQNVENTYKALRKNWSTQYCANVLPNAIKSEIVITGFEKDWKYLFDLRVKGITGNPHPQMVELITPVWKEFKKRNYIKD